MDRTELISQLNQDIEWQAQGEQIVGYIGDEPFFAIDVVVRGTSSIGYQMSSTHPLCSNYNFKPSYSLPEVKTHAQDLLITRLGHAYSDTLPKSVATVKDPREKYRDFSDAAWRNRHLGQ